MGHCYIPHSHFSNLTELKMFSKWNVKTIIYFTQVILQEVLDSTVTSFKEIENKYKAKLKATLLQYFSKLQNAFIIAFRSNI